MPFETSDSIIETQDGSTWTRLDQSFLRRPLSNSCSQVCYRCYRVTSHTARRQEKCVFPRQPSTLQASIQIRRYAAFQSSVPHQPSNEPIHQVRAESWIHIWKVRYRTEYSHLSSYTIVTTRQSLVLVQTSFPFIVLHSTHSFRGSAS